MRLGINISLTQQSGGFSPASLFSGGQQGAWYDPSDINTLFQDSAGTTPVTTAGQPVGLILDKSQGLTTGVDVASGPWINTFATAFDTFSSSSSDGFTATTSTAKTGIRVGVPCAFVEGQPYVISFTLTATNASVGGVWFSNSILGGTQAIQNPAQVTSGVRYRAQGVAPAGVTHLMMTINTTGASSVSLSGLTANALPGNHATQATAGSRPIYGVQPISGRRNLMAVSSQPSASDGTSVTANAAVGPSGQMTAARVSKTDATTPRYVLMGTSMTTQASTVYTLSQYVKYDGYDTTVSLEYNGVANFNVPFIATFNVTASGVSAVTPSLCTSAVTNEGNGWYRVSATFTSAAGPFAPATNPLILSRVTGASGVTVLMTDIQVEVAAAPTVFQNVVSQYNVTEAGVQSVFYLSFDGIDDWLYTAAIDFSGTDETTLTAGLRKVADTAFSVVAELTLDSGINNGGYVLVAPSNPTTNSYAWLSRGTAAAAKPLTGYPAPDTAVLTGFAKISANICNLRINGTQGANVGSTQGTGNRANAPFCIGRRGNSLHPFNGWLYGLINIGRLLTSEETSSLERWVNSKTGAY